MLHHSPSGDLFGMSQDVGMGWDGKRIADAQVLILTTMGGLRQDDGTPLALGITQVIGNGLISKSR